MTPKMQMSNYLDTQVNDSYESTCVWELPLAVYIVVGYYQDVVFKV